MGAINDTFFYNNAAQNGATCQLWPYNTTVFPTWPAQDDALPGPSNQIGASVTTGVTYGGAGAFAFTNLADGEYIVSFSYSGHIVYKYYQVSTVTGNPVEFVKQQKGYYYGPTGARQTTPQVTTLTINQMYAVPFLLDESTTYDRAGILIGAVAAGTVRVNVYSDNGGTPYALLYGSNALVASAGAAAQETINLTLNRGRYWLAGVTNGATTTFANASSWLGILDISGSATAVAGPNYMGAFYATFNFATAPAYFPTITSGGTCVPWFMLRKGTV